MPQETCNLGVTCTHSFLWVWILAWTTSSSAMVFPLQWCCEARWGSCGAQPVEENGLLCWDPFHNFSSYQRQFLQFFQSSLVTCFFSFIRTKNRNVILIAFKACTDCNYRGPQQLELSHLPFVSFRIAAVCRRNGGSRVLGVPLLLRGCARAVLPKMSTISDLNFMNDVTKLQLTARLHEQNFTSSNIMTILFAIYCDIHVPVYYYAYISGKYQNCSVEMAEFGLPMVGPPWALVEGLRPRVATLGFISVDCSCLKVRSSV